MALSDYRQAIVSGLKYVIAQQQKSGTIEPAETGLAAYHKVPYMFSLVGQAERATRLCTWLEETVMDDDGDFADPQGRQGAMGDFYHYPNSWIIMGAHRLELFNISYPGMGFLTTLQHPGTGGFLTAGPNAGLEDRQDLLSTAVAGLACIQTGHLEEAERAGYFLANVLESQTKRLYFYLENTDEFVTDYEDDEATSHSLVLGRPGQWYFIPGLAACFLTKLYQATENDPFLEAAQGYVQFADSSGADRYGPVRSGFLGLAAALLFRMTDVTHYEEIATEVGENIIDAQMSNGSWAEASMGYKPPAPIVDATAENVIVLNGILQVLGGTAQ
jgi:hypothetical protein